ncbi:hypothetical protein OHC33_010109 [Knufia fluminis]|uniref:Uncharacterized protein n=2 Tax=Knufia TaxID=430999 RepID=A0AAN8E9A5_9EURO|nr:hypothetical protein OHC33_010109 [Knufia fluminis]
MCYTVVIAHGRCNEHPPDKTTAQLCWRLCKKRAKEANTYGSWDEVCERPQRMAKVVLTDVAKVTVNAEDCEICAHVDTDTIALQDSLHEKKEELNELHQQSEDLKEDMEELRGSRLKKAENDLNAIQTSAKEMQGSIDVLKNRIRDKEEDLRTKHLLATAEEADTEPDSNELPIYLRALVSDRERWERSFHKDCPERFPKKDSEAWKQLDGDGILPAGVKLPENPFPFSDYLSSREGGGAADRGRSPEREGSPERESSPERAEWGNQPGDRRGYVFPDDSSDDEEEE